MCLEKSLHYVYRGEYAQFIVIALKIMSDTDEYSAQRLNLFSKKKLVFFSVLHINNITFNPYTIQIKVIISVTRLTFLLFFRQRGQEGKGVVFLTNLIARFSFNPHPGHRFCIFAKTLYDDCLCLVASDNHAANSVEKNSKIGSLETPKQVQIHPITKLPLQ